MLQVYKPIMSVIYSKHINYVLNVCYILYIMQYKLEEEENSYKYNKSVGKMQSNLNVWWLDIIVKISNNIFQSLHHLIIFLISGYQILCVWSIKLSLGILRSANCISGTWKFLRDLQFSEIASKDEVGTSTCMPISRHLTCLICAALSTWQNLLDLIFYLNMNCVFKVRIVH